MTPRLMLILMFAKRITKGLRASNMFSTNPIQLNQLLEEIHVGKMQLPEFQRGWIWDDYRIRDLLASVAQGFPIGAIMRLDAGGDLSFKSRPIQGAKPVQDPDTFLLDGQQRLTSLYQALKFDGPVDTHNVSKKKIQQWYYVDMMEALCAHRDTEKMIFSVPKNRVRTTDIGRTTQLDLSTPELEYQQHMIPTERLLDPLQWFIGYVGYWTSKQHPEGAPESFFNEFNDEIIKSFQNFPLPVIDLDKRLPREAVCVVFDKVNTGGIALTTFELLTAILASQGFDLREDWSNRQQRIRDYSNVLRGTDKDQFIRAVALLVTSERRNQAKNAGRTTLPPIACRRSEILSIDRDEYTHWAGVAEEGFKDAARFLARQSIFSTREVPYTTQITSLASIFALLGNETKNANMQQKLERWFWSGIFGERYSGTTETVMANDAQQVPGYLGEDVSLPMLEEANFEPARLLSLRTRNTAAYKGINALLMKNGATDWLSDESIRETNFYDDNIDIHHIFPRRWCEREAQELLGTKIPRRIFNSAINKSPLSARTNRIIGGRAPSTYVERLRRHASEVERAIEGHHMDINHLKSDDFVEFFVERGKSLMRLIGDAMGKELPDGEEVFRNALETANLRVETDEYDDEEEEEFILQPAA